MELGEELGAYSGPPMVKVNDEFTTTLKSWRTNPYLARQLPVYVYNWCFCMFVP